MIDSVACMEISCGLPLSTYKKIKIIMDGYRLYKYVDNRSVLVIKPNGKLARVYCPFPVMDNKQMILTVEAITEGNNGILYYSISGTLYEYSCFSILIK